MHLINCYFPGEGRDHPTKFPAKKFYADLLTYLEQNFDASDLVLYCRMNVALSDKDVASSQRMPSVGLKQENAFYLRRENGQHCWIGV